MEVRFGSKCNGKALKGLRIFQTGNSCYNMHGWKGNSERRKTWWEAISEVQLRDDSGWNSMESNRMERRDGFKIHFCFYAKYSHGQIKITKLENKDRGRNNTVQILLL